MTRDEPLTLLEKVAYPTVWLSQGSEKKWVRALGEIGVVTLMLPWTIAFFVIAFTVLYPISAVIEQIFDNIDDWWDSV